MQKLKIDLTKIDKNHLFKGAKGTYLDLTLMENKGGQDQYGNAGFIVQDIGKEAREAGERGPIIGNWKHIDVKPKSAPPKANDAPPKDDFAPDDIPF